MARIKVGIMGFGTIGQRLADAVVLQKDMELVGVSDVSVTLPIRALYEKGMPYHLYLASTENELQFKNAHIPISGSLEDLASQAEIILDASPTGMGAIYRNIYEQVGVKAVFQGAEKNNHADMFFHSEVNYSQAITKNILKMTSCYVTGIMRVLAAVEKQIGIKKVAITVIRRAADPGDYHRGLTNALQISPAPCQMALDINSLLPKIKASGILVHAPITHSHVITLVISPEKKVDKHDVLNILSNKSRIRIVSIADGFIGNASLFKYARDLGNLRGDMHEIAVWEDTITINDGDIMLAINVAQEGVVIPENIDAVRALAGLQKDSKKAMEMTDQYLGIGRHLRLQHLSS